MDFDQLTTFAEVVRQKSFSRAGEKVFLSQSAVSAQIRQLEEEYGEKLLDRAGKFVRLTPAGEVLFEYAQRLMTLRSESKRAVADQASTPRGVLTVGANEATCLYVLPEIFTEYHRLHPAVQIAIYRNFSHKIIERVEEGTIDTGIATLPIKSASLHVHPIFRDRIMLMTSIDNPLARRSSVTIGEVAEQPVILPRTGFTRQMLDKFFRPYRSQLRVSMELPSIAMIKRFVAAGLGVSLISSRFAMDEVNAGQAALIPIADVDLWRELGLVYRRGRSLPRATTAFIQMLTKEGRLKASSPQPKSSHAAAAGRRASGER
jgi:LysR family transcriptional regulator, low CO2-responsive transcriptional regulator